MCRGDYVRIKIIIIIIIIYLPSPSQSHWNVQLESSWVNSQLTAPVVHQHHPEDVFLCGRHRQRLPERVPSSHEERHLQFKVEQTRRAKLRLAAYNGHWV